MASQLWASLKMYIIQCADYVTATDTISFLYKKLIEIAACEFLNFQPKIACEFLNGFLIFQVTCKNKINL